MEYIYQEPFGFPPQSDPRLENDAWLTLPLTQDGCDWENVVDTPAMREHLFR
jgi:hypothetical protein